MSSSVYEDLLDKHDIAADSIKTICMMVKEMSLFNGDYYQQSGCSTGNNDYEIPVKFATKMLELA